MDKYVENYIDAYQYGKSKDMFWGSFLTVNFDGSSHYHCRSCTPLEAPHLTPDGYVSACDMVVLGSESYHMNSFIVGRWDAVKHDFVFDEKKIAALNERKCTNMKHCKKCPVQMQCGGYCLGEIVNETGNLFGQNKIKCKAIQYLFQRMGGCEPYRYLHP